MVRGGNVRRMPRPAGEEGERRGPLRAVPGECGQEERAPTAVGGSSNRTGPKLVLRTNSDFGVGLWSGKHA